MRHSTPHQMLWRSDIESLLPEAVLFFLLGLAKYKGYKSYRTHGTVEKKWRALVRDFLFSTIP